jgi:hypothetical protein
MGSRLYGEREVTQLLETAGLDLAAAEHDWVLPYGLYRQLPDQAAAAVRWLDNGFDTTPVGRYLASVSYWDARVSEA